MKVLLFTIENPSKGDLVIVECSDIKTGEPRGRDDTTYRVIGAHQRAKVGPDGIVEELVDVPAETPRAIATALADGITRHWLSEAFSAGVTDADELKVFVTDLVNVRFLCSVAGEGGTRIKMREL